MTIIGKKQRYIKFKSSEYQHCNQTVTRKLEMSVNFAILPNFFKKDRQEQEEELQKFARDVLTYLYLQLKVLVQFFALNCFNDNYFNDSYHSIIFCSYVFLVNLPRSIISLSAVRYQWDETERMLYPLNAPLISNSSILFETILSFKDY